MHRNQEDLSECSTIFYFLILTDLPPNRWASNKRQSFLGGSWNGFRQARDYREYIIRPQTWLRKEVHNFPSRTSKNHSLHTIDSADEMRKIDSFDPSCSDKKILVEIRHSHYLSRRVHIFVRDNINAVELSKRGGCNIPSWGTTCPMERTSDLCFCFSGSYWRFSHTFLFNCAGQGSFTMPRVASETYNRMHSLQRYEFLLLQFLNCLYRSYYSI